eukprot:TRINITY_DN9336_c1_g1_i1.p1 TRINITY_DN9336_c1_g1~~TRINITY_DN9336_c1_g1_i1.p1  ORF type:complete len:390 (+),score=70.46 TRINITY_DN9336_c1_g1_i1:100-1269(+)
MLPNISSSHSYRGAEELPAAGDGQSDSKHCDDIFGVMVRRHVRLRKQLAGSRRTHSVAGHEHNTATVEHQRSSLSKMLRTSANVSADANTVLGSRARHSSRERNLRNEHVDPESLLLSPWEMLVKEHRRRVQAYEDVPQAPQNDDLIMTEDLEDEPAAPSQAPRKKKHPPAPPPAAAGWLGMAARQKQMSAMEQEQKRQREQQESEWEREFCQQEQRQREVQQRARRERLKARCSQSEKADSCETEGSPLSDKSGWKPWRLPSLLKRQPSKTHQQSPLSGRAGYWGGRWPWRNSKVAPECEQGPCNEETKAPTIETTAAEESRIHLHADNLMEGIDEELDRTRHQSLQERRKTFRELQRQLHPDKNMSDPESAKRAFQYLMDNRRSYLR